MHLTYYPFFSQQDKVQGLFRLGSDSGVRLYSYMAKRSLEQGWRVSFVLPQPSQCVDSAPLPEGVEVLRVPYSLALCNLERRLQWDPAWLKRLPGDIVLTQHEFLAYPLRCLRPELTILMECGIRPETAWPQTAGLFPLAHAAADLVHCNSRQLATMPNSTVWSFGYDDSVAVSRGLSRDVDVLFNARASSTEYSNHSAFVRAMSGTGLSVRMTDPTRYLESVAGAPEAWLSQPLPRGDYVDLLHRSKVVVGLVDNGYGGYAFQEAIAAGCCPVALRTPEYEDILTENWPYYCTLDTVADAAERAVRVGWRGISTKTVRRVQVNIAKSAYSAAWEAARKDIERVVRERD